VANTLAEHCGSLDALAAMSEEDLQEIPSIGPAIAASVARFFQERHNRELIKRFRAAGVHLAGQKRRMAGALSGMVFVLTGTLPGLTREDAKELIEKHGGTVASSVTKQVTHVLAGADAGSKLAKARSLGVPIIDEDALRGIIA
jgi:DNA ligase (NAD+)